MAGAVAATTTPDPGTSSPVARSIPWTLPCQSRCALYIQYVYHTHYTTLLPDTSSFHRSQLRAGSWRCNTETTHAKDTSLDKHMSCITAARVHLWVTTPFSSVQAVKYMIPLSRFMAGVPSMPYSGSSEQATLAALAAVTPADALVKSVCHSGGLPGLSASKAYACACRVTMKTTLKAAVGGLPGKPVSPGTYSGCKPERTRSLAVSHTVHKLRMERQNAHSWHKRQ
jgi:hypothetical protein